MPAVSGAPSDAAARALPRRPQLFPRRLPQTVTAATPHRRSPVPAPPAAPGPRVRPHPSVLLDLTCAACCIFFLASSASRHVSDSATATATAPKTSRAAETAASAQPAATAAPHSIREWTVVGAVAGCTLVMAVSNAWFKISGSGRSQTAGTAVATEAAARLARLEALTDKQLAEFSAAVRQIDKLQVRTRLTSGDIKRPIAQLQSSAADQSAVLVRLAGEQEALRGQLRDTQALLAALQGLTAKQFQVTVEAIKQLRAAQASAAAGAAESTAPASAAVSGGAAPGSRAPSAT